MADSKFSVAVFGHSFVRRVGEFSASSPDPRISKHFNMSDVFSVSFIGVGGATAQSIHRHIRRVGDIAPRAVILELGTNDLARNMNTPHHIAALHVATEILALAHKILNLSGVQHVCIGQVIHRTGQPGFNERVDKYNCILKELCGVEPQISYWSHRRLWNNTIRTLANDGVHLSSYGNYQYFFSLKRAAIYAKNEVHRH